MCASTSHRLREIASVINDTYTYINIFRSHDNQLYENIEYDNGKQPIKLPRIHSTIGDGSEVRIVGWGASVVRAMSKPSRTLYQAVKYCNRAV